MAWTQMIKEVSLTNYVYVKAETWVHRSTLKSWREAKLYNGKALLGDGSFIEAKDVLKGYGFSLRDWIRDWFECS
jgi:hypothetical protein